MGSPCKILKFQTRRPLCKTCHSFCTPIIFPSFPFRPFSFLLAWTCSFWAYLCPLNFIRLCCFLHTIQCNIQSLSCTRTQKLVHDPITHCNISVSQLQEVKRGTETAETLAMVSSTKRLSIFSFYLLVSNSSTFLLILVIKERQETGEWRSQVNPTKWEGAGDSCGLCVLKAHWPAGRVPLWHFYATCHNLPRSLGHSSSPHIDSSSRALLGLLP